jgi:hypothetical protein
VALSFDFQRRKIWVKMEFAPISGLHGKFSNLGSQKRVLASGILGRRDEMFPDSPVTDLEEVASETLLI